MTHGPRTHGHLTPQPDALRHELPGSRATQGTHARSAPLPPRIWSQAEYQALLTTIHTMAAPHGGAKVFLHSEWRSEVRWGRNRITNAGDWRDVLVKIDHADGNSQTNQTDLGTLQGMLTWAERLTQRFHGRLAGPVPAVLPQEGRAFPPTYIWSDTTYNQTQDTRLQIVEQLMTAADAKGMLSAGSLSIRAQGYVIELPDGRVEYAPVTMATCTISVRDPSGTGSGWAGASSYDWGRIDAQHLATVALEKCLASRHPVRIEPGRYTLIMEPEATFDLMKGFMGYWIDGPPGPNAATWDYAIQRWKTEPNGVDAVFHDPKRTQIAVSAYGSPEDLGSTRIGQRVMDPRISISWDPTDPDLGRIPYQVNDAGTDVYPVDPVHWVTNGVLTALGYAPGMTVDESRSRLGFVGAVNGVTYPRLGFRMDGGTTTIEEMIATTERGILATRFSSMRRSNGALYLYTGMTRDGTWLIEQGKIAHPVQNLRWIESPMFVFNQVEQIGAAVPVSWDDPYASGPAMTPPIKARDFNFTAVEDSI